MPTSQLTQLHEIVNFVDFFKFRRLLDAGIGFGQYGFMLRQHVANSFDLQVMTIDGIEGYAPYITDLQRHLYNHIYTERVEEVLPVLADKTYECALLIDVLEHLHVATAREVVTQLRRVAPVVLLSTPMDWREQVSASNPLENHVSFWTRRALGELGAIAFLPNERSHLAIFATQAYTSGVRNYAFRRQRWAYVPIPLRRRALALRRLFRRRA